MAIPADSTASLPVAPIAAVRVRKPHGPLAMGFIRTAANPVGMFGMIILAVLVLTALFAPVLAPYDPLLQHPGLELSGPSRTFPLGTDELGRDILSRLIYGARPSLLVAVMVVAMAGGLGIFSGLLAGFLGGWIDTVLMRLFDSLLAFPAILLGFAVVAILGPGTTQVAYAIAFATLPGLARVTRALVLRERNRDYILAARSMGASGGRVMFKHVLPNSLPPLFVNLALLMGFSILAEAALAFLGLGTRPPLPSWGAMLNESRTYLRVAPWLAISPGGALAFLLLGLNYLADALRDAFDPRRINAGL